MLCCSLIWSGLVWSGLVQFHLLCYSSLGCCHQCDAVWDPVADPTIPDSVTCNAVFLHSSPSSQSIIFLPVHFVSRMGRVDGVRCSTNTGADIFCWLVRLCCEIQIYSPICILGASSCKQPAGTMSDQDNAPKGALGASFTVCMCDVPSYLAVMR